MTEGKQVKIIDNSDLPVPVGTVVTIVQPPTNVITDDCSIYAKMPDGSIERLYDHEYETA